MAIKQRVYCFLSDENKKFYRATQQPNGDYTITSNSQPYPIEYNPSNLLNSEIEFSTNQKYFFVARSINYPLEFIKDGAAILRNFYYNGKGIEQKCYLTIIQWNGINQYELGYYGRFDLGQKKENTKSGSFTCPCIDDSCWGVLSQNDGVEYSIECNNTNIKAVKVLIDGVTLINKYTFQTVQAPIVHSELSQFLIMPFVLVNQDGDSTGLLVSSQTSNPINISQSGGWHIVDQQNPGFFFLTQYAINGVNITGTISFEWSTVLSFIPIDVSIQIISNQKTYTDTGIIAFGNIIMHEKGLVKGKIYTYNFNFTLDLNADERLFLVIFTNSSSLSPFEITPITTNIYINTKTTTQPTIIYGLRPLDYLRELVGKATNNRFTINSSFFVENNKDIITSGDAIRGISDAKIYGSFKDFFQTFDSIYFLALRVINGDLWIEQADTVYNDNQNILYLGEAEDVDFEPAIEYFGNEIEVGSPKQDFRHPSGRLEFNSTNTFSLNILSVNKKISYISKYRLGCFDIIFLLLDYQGGSTKDNSGDKSVYLINISDDKGFALENVETFENIVVDNALLEPVIKSPLNNETISNTNPFLIGVATSGANINIFVDNVLDGSTIADSSGNWSYLIVNSLTPYLLPTQTGVHIIDATFTDESAPKSTIQLLIDTSFTQPTIITYPNQDDNLYNNLPLIKGSAQAGTSVNLKIDGVSIATIIADGSCKWTFKFLSAISNGNHTLDANGYEIDFTVDNNISHPLITYIGGEIDGFVINNNLPLIKGISIPGTDVDLWLNYISYKQLNWNSVTNSRIPIISDLNGNWSFQVVPLNYRDPVSGSDVILSPIINGSNIISTSLINYTVGINETGYKLNRPNFSSITGVTDNTVFNVNYTPKRMLLAHKSMLSAINKNQPLENIYFQTADKNGVFSTTLSGITIKENENISVSSLGEPMATLEYGNITVKTNNTFAKTLYNFSNGGNIKVTYRGYDLYFLPIGSMKIGNISSNIQQWKLLLSNITPYSTLLNLYRNGLNITLNKNTMYHSDRNSLHLVTYGFVQSNKYNFLEIYDDWFNNRNSAWVFNPVYIQKVQTDEIWRDQIIVNGATGLTLRIFRCKDASIVDTLAYSPVIPAPINPPQVILETIIDWSLYPTAQYFTILFSGETPIAIGERVETKDKWPGTILVESSNSQNDVGFYYSSGIQTILRVEGLVKKLQPSINTIVAQEESGDTEILYAQNSRKRIIRFGTAYGLPDYLYLKIADALTNDNCYIENVGYTLDKDEKINPSDDVDGHPLYYYNVNMTLSDNQKGKTFNVPGDINTVILVVDGQAVGLPPDSLLNIEL